MGDFVDFCKNALLLALTERGDRLPVAIGCSLLLAPVLGYGSGWQEVLQLIESSGRQFSALKRSLSKCAM